MFELTLLLLRAITMACRGHHDVVLENLAVPRQYRVRAKTIDVGVAGRHSTRRCEPSSGRVLRSDRLGRRVETSCSRLLPCATNSASSLVRISAFAQLTGCFGCVCAGSGPGGGKRWC